MSDDSKELSRVEDILSGEDYLPKKPMSRVEELLMNGAMVPKVDDTDNGKVLKVIDGEWQPGEDVSGDNLPPVSSLDNGKVLKVVSGEWNIGDDKSESSFVYISSSYPFSGSKVALPANINSVLIANYTSSPKVPTFLVTSNNIIFEPKEVDISVGTTPSVHIRWGRMYSTFDSATREQDIYNDSISYNTQNQTTEASYFKTKAIQTIPPVDTPDNGKVMQVAGGHWVANILPEVDGVPQVTSSDVGKVLKATDENTYGWEDVPDPLPAVTSSDNGKVLKVVEGVWDKGDIPSSVTSVEIEAEDYHTLTTVEKEDPTKIYFVKAGRVITDPVSVISRNPSSSNIDCNTGSASYNTSAVYAFDGIMNSPPDARATSAYSVTAWYPGYGNAPASAWASYHFDSVITNLVKLEVYAYNMATSDPSATFTTPVIVEGSTDGTTWFNILADGDSSFTLNSKETEFVKNVIPIDNTVSVSYIRIRFLNQINGYNDTNFAIAEIYAYTGNVVVYDDSTYYMGIKHGKTIQELPDLLAADEGKVLKAVNGKWSKDDIYRELTQAEYDALPSSKNSDGIIYFING